MFNPHQTISEILNDVLPNERTKDVIARRFGLSDGSRQTLEEIGQEYGITRERVRQIEANGLSALSEQEIITRLEPHFEMIKNHLAEHGDLRREDSLLSDLSYVCFPVAGLDNKTPSDDSLPDFSRCQSSLYLLLVLGSPFLKEKESQKFHPLWTINKASLTTARKVVDFFAKHFQKASQTLEFKDLLQKAKEVDSNLTEKALISYLDASKEVASNKFGHYGLSHWPEITPKGVKDKSYLVLKKHGQPLHFSEITSHINEHSLDAKRAQVETVHNELIKDSRFVLIGRGIYALSEWGYQSGTVADIIAGFLKENGSLAKEEIINKVLEKRMIKENTILINLQNRKYFTKGEDGKYTLRKV
jgi:hypothetical protein